MNRLGKFIKYIKLQLKIFKEKFFIIYGAILSIISIISTFFPNLLNNLFEKWQTGLSYLLVSLLLTIIITIIYIYNYNQVEIINRSDKSLIIQYGNLFNFCKDNKKKIVVINANTSFDTVVDTNESKIVNPLVSENTIHGKWIKFINGYGISPEELNKELQENLDSRNVCYTKITKDRGNNRVYEKGTIAIFEHDNIIYYVLALSDFNDKNEAHCSKEDLINAIEKLIFFYDEKGMGYDIYLPLMGAGLSRTDISDQESLEIITSLFKYYFDRCRGNVNVVVYEKNRDKVSLKW